jgi:hypothetical protein
MKYLTLGQYRRVSDGVSLADVSDMILAMMISRAEAAIDAHMGFDEKRGGYEPHQIMIQAPFDERTRKVFDVLYHLPLRNVTRFRIQVSNVTQSGAGFFAEINPGDCVINNDQHYVEIVPLQAVTYALSPVILQLGLRPAIVDLDCEVGFYNSVYKEPLINDGQNKTFYATDGFWASSYSQALHTQPNQVPPTSPNLYVNDVLASQSTYSVDYTEGSVTFNSVQLPTARVTADFVKTIPDYVTEACILQVTYLLGRRNLNKLGAYKGLYRIRTGEQELDYPVRINVNDTGRVQASSLCDDAAAILTRYQGIGIA